MIAAFFISVFELPLQYPRRCVAVGRAFFKAVVFSHRLIVEVFSIDDEKHLVDIRERRRKLRRLERCQRLAAPRRVPDIAARIERSHLLVVGRYFNPVQYALGRRNLIRTHDHQDSFRSENAIFGQHIQNGVLGEECFCKIDKVGNHLVVAVCPERSKLKTVARFLRFPPRRFAHLFDMAVSGSVGIILGMRSIGDDKYLHILI